MRSFLLLLLLQATYVTTWSQPTAYKELSVGDSIPLLPLHTVMNNNTGKKYLSEFKGKLVILDFWDTYCTTCIAAFPKMEELQKRFEGQIQILLVNTRESEEEIRSRIKKIPALKKLGQPNLPSMVDAEFMDTLFPHKAVPYHVWIDGDGIVRFKGNPLNTHESKIKDFLEGNEVRFMQEGSKYDGSLPIETLLPNNSGRFKYYFLITGFTDLFSDYWGRQPFINKIDSGAGTIRNTYVNRDLAQLYTDAVADEMDSSWKQNLNLRADTYLNKVSLEVNDTLTYTWRFLPSEKWTDDVLRNAKFCYEQIASQDLASSARQKHMLEDLNAYFGALYDLEGIVETKKERCYLLVRTSNKDKLKAKATSRGTNFSIIHGIKMEEFHNYTLKDVIKTILYEARNGEYNKDLFQVSDILLDETGYTDSVDIRVPYAFEGGIKSLDDLRRVLNVYDLDIVKGERSIKRLVLRENRSRAGASTTHLE